ncbi:thrombospondin type 3 repeat-containing protein, partial [bacterium]|nr:thrombospondin type 3 repeat-containing protein [bacterium]
MKKIMFFLFLTLIIVASIFAEEVLYKFSAGPSGGIVKTGGVYDYWALGQTYGGTVKFGITKELELGIQGAYNYCYPGDNIDFFPFPLRSAETKELLPLSEFHPPGNAFVVVPDTSNPRGYRLESYHKIRFSTGTNKDLPVKLIAMPIEFFLQWRSFTHTIFNPYIQIGGGILAWKAVNDETSELFEVAYEPEASYGDALPETTWVEYKGRHFHAMLGFGFEIFPVEQVGIDLGFRGYYAFFDDQAVFTLDSLVGWAELSARLNFYYGGVRDSDKDGVIDKDDQCPHTPFGAVVDEFGCPVDSDGDGVFDGLDQCPNTPLGAMVDAGGCPSDGDGDGVYDGVDKCPDTPTGAKVDDIGCPVDSDGDGVPDHTDNCPNTPMGALVDLKGCPLDGDGDGAYDGIDKCPNTPIGTPVNQFGCPQTKADSDGDGVPDDVDNCPDTPNPDQADSDIDGIGDACDTVPPPCEDGDLV